MVVGFVFRTERRLEFQKELGFHFLATEFHIIFFYFENPKPLSVSPLESALSYLTYIILFIVNNC